MNFLFKNPLNWHSIKLCFGDKLAFDRCKCWGEGMAFVATQLWSPSSSLEVPLSEADFKYLLGGEGRFVNELILLDEYSVPYSVYQNTVEALFVLKETMKKGIRLKKMYYCPYSTFPKAV